MIDGMDTPSFCATTRLLQPFASRTRCKRLPSLSTCLSPLANQFTTLTSVTRLRKRNGRDRAGPSQECTIQVSVIGRCYFPMKPQMRAPTPAKSPTIEMK